MENKNMKNVLLAIVVIIVIFVVGFFLGKGLFNKVSSSNNNSSNEQVTDNNTDNNMNNSTEVEENTEPSNSLSCKNVNTTINGINIQIEEKDGDGVCVISKFKINDKDIKDDLNLWVDAYDVLDNNVIILSRDTSGSKLDIYSLASKSMVVKLTPEKLEGYWPESYTLDGSDIMISGSGCGEQCGYDESSYKKEATFKMSYSNGVFSSPKIVN